MHIKSKVWPYVVYAVETIFGNDHFHTHLYPGGHADNKTNIPFRRFSYNFFQLARPVPLARNFFTRFIKWLEPERNFFGSNAAEIPGIITAAFLQRRTTTKHEPAFADRTHR